MDTERDVARGIQRQKVAQARANLASGVGCIVTGLVLAIVIGAAGLVGLWSTAVLFIISFAVGASIYRRVLTRNLDR